jgi:hypothetical protein
VQCQGFATEDYDLYALGSAEPEQDSQIDAHLASSCGVCEDGIRRSLRFWALYGVSLSPVAERSAQRRIQFIPVRSRSLPAYLRLGAVAATVALMAGSITWFATRGADQHALKQLAAELADSKTKVNQLEAANASRPGPAVSEKGPVATPAPDVVRIGELDAQLRAKERELGGLRKSLEDADSRYQQSMTALAAEKANAAQLVSALTQQKDLVAKGTAEQGRQSAQMQATSASLQAAEEQTRRLTAEAVSLTRERASLQAAVQRMEAQAGEGRRMLSMLSAPGTRLIPVNGTGAAPAARGYALVSEKNRVLFFANDLPALPSGRVYQLWLIRDKSPAIVSAGVFEAQPTKSAQVEFAQGDLVQGVRAIAVTDEPAGGSATPTGHKLLMGLVKS